MVFSRGFCASSVRIISVGILLLFYTCQVHSQTDMTASIDNLTVQTSQSTSAKIAETTPRSSLESTPGTDADTATATITTPLTALSTTTPITSSSGITPSSTETTAYTSPSETTEYTTFNSTDAATTGVGPVGPVTPVTPVCPGGFPFSSSNCLTPGENGGVVITAFILSIVSFIGVLGAASYTFFFRKYFSAKKRRMMSNYNVPGQEMAKLKPTVNIYDEQEVGNRAKGKRQEAALDQSSSHQKSKQTRHHQSNTTDLDDGQF